MKIEITGDALKLFQHFLHYGKSNMEELADAMYYDHEGFKWRLDELQKAYNNARIDER